MSSNDDVCLNPELGRESIPDAVLEPVSPECLNPMEEAAASYGGSTGSGINRGERRCA